MRFKTFQLIIVFLLLVSPIGAYPAEVPDLKRAKGYQGNIPVRVIKEVPLPKGYHEGLFHDGENIWVNNGENGNTWLVDTGTGEVMSEVIPPGTFSEGITIADNGTFWVTDWNEKKIYRVKIEAGRMNVEYDISLDPARPTGIVWTGEKLYVLTWERGLGTKYYLMQLDREEHMSRKMRIKRIHEPSQLAWDGRRLWITSWYSDLVYKVDVDTFSVLGSFRSPAKRTTGIAWDGKHFWLTGTHAGLYQVEVGGE
ncbi:MAG: glutaminyl-peptide cyclotransferase [Candidatus Omnitrophota bacterium]|nr:glutaminyl-peptide cyclotransferase [Candidatus Omnitrophota bacterium]